MNNKVVSFEMTTIAAIGLSLLGAPATTVADETTEDNLTLLSPVEERSRGITTTDPSDETTVSAKDGTAIQQYSGCPVGYTCIRQSKHYSGRYRLQNNHGQVIPDGMNNKASSVVVNGSKCRIIRSYDSSNPSGALFVLDSQQHDRDYQDLNLSNGIGYGKNQAENWENRINYIPFDKH